VQWRSKTTFSLQTSLTFVIYVMYIEKVKASHRYLTFFSPLKMHFDRKVKVYKLKKLSSLYDYCKVLGVLCEFETTRV